MKPSDIYVDLGTNNTLIYGKRQGLLLNEPTMLALQKVRNKKKNLAIGHSAKLMLGKTPSHLNIVRPLKGGVIDDFSSTAEMLHSFLKLVKNQMIWSRSRMVISLPCLVSQQERQSVEDVGYDMGASIVHLLHEPIAGAIGANLDVLENRASGVVDIGAGTTEVAIITKGSLVTAKAVRIGGNDIDEAIIHLLQERYHFLVGEQTAERIKTAVATADPQLKFLKTIEVGGLDLMTGLPQKRSIDSNMIFPAVEMVFRKIVETVAKAFDECPPEVSGDLAEKGIVLFGGSALLKGLKEYFSEQLGVPVSLAENPLMAVTIGGARILENGKLFDSLERP